MFLKIVTAVVQSVLTFFQTRPCKNHKHWETLKNKV